MVRQFSDSENDYGLQVTKFYPGRFIGSYTFDGLVDSADFTVWRDRLGMAGVDMPADGNEIKSIVVDKDVDQETTASDLTPSLNYTPAVDVGQQQIDPIEERPSLAGRGA